MSNDLVDCEDCKRANGGYARGGWFKCFKHADWENWRKVMNNRRVEWCENCKAIDNDDVTERYCYKHFVPNHNSTGYSNPHGPFNDPLNYYIGKLHEPKPEEINEEPIKCECEEVMGSYKQYSGNVKIEMKCSLCGRIEHTFGNYEGKCTVGGIKQKEKADD
jgi:hypothetical protein